MLLLWFELCVNLYDKIGSGWKWIILQHKLSRYSLTNLGSCMCTLLTKIVYCITQSLHKSRTHVVTVECFHLYTNVLVTDVCLCLCVYFVHVCLCVLCVHLCYVSVHVCVCLCLCMRPLRLAWFKIKLVLNNLCNVLQYWCSNAVNCVLAAELIH